MSRIITRVEDILTDSGDFTLPAKRMPEAARDVEVVVVDAAETEIKRPKKNKNAIIRASVSGIR